MQNYSEKLLSGQYKIGVWGAGFIGLSTMAHFARAGVSGIAVDVAPKTVDAINQGEVEAVGLKEWLGFDLKPLVEKSLVHATTDHTRLLQPDILAHFICIPTEKDGKPYYPYLKDVIGKLCQLPEADPQLPPLVILESTLTPGTTEKVIIPEFEANGKRIGKDILLGVAPRRDWFVDGTKSLKDLDRVFGGFDDATTEAMRQVLSIACDALHAGSSHRTAEMVKSIENAYRHMEITLANQLTLAYPGEDLREVLQLVGTKWNIGTFYPGFGVGGYCIPLSSHYVIEGAEHPEELTLLADTIQTDQNINKLIAQSLISRGAKNVGVLGLAYKANLKVSILSPTIPLIQELVANGVAVKLNDPYYSAQEVLDLVGVPVFKFPEGLGEFDAVVLVVDHDEFKELGAGVTDHLSNCSFILDNHAIWRTLKPEFSTLGITYHVCGDANWLGQATTG